MGASCDICKELFSEKCDVTAIRCGHIYHEKCIKLWLNNSRSCPKCRSPTKTGNIVKLFFSISPDDGIPAKAELEREISNLSASIESKCVELKLRTDMAAEAENDLNNVSRRIAELQNRVQDTQIRFLKTTNETYNSLLSEMTNLENVLIAVKNIWDRPIDHQQRLESRILEVLQEFEECKQMLQGNNPTAAASKEIPANIDLAPLERRPSRLASDPNMQSNRECDVNIASRQNSVNLDDVSLWNVPYCSYLCSPNMNIRSGRKTNIASKQNSVIRNHMSWKIPDCSSSPCRPDMKISNERKPNIPSEQNVNLYNVWPKMPSYRVGRDRHTNIAPTQYVFKVDQVSRDLPISHLNRNLNMKSRGQSQTDVESVCSTLV